MEGRNVMAPYARRNGDTRPFESPVKERLAWHPLLPIRWLPRHGQPGCLIEWVSQKFVRLSAWLPFYIAVIATLTLVVVLFR